ncbi:MAG: hypothetical protein J7K54_01430 [Candidatus Aenigmarchaeota archaeon]|nr:hypothetical protein [Candidatus Aenigmarchaeota archaeon]
MAKITGKTTLGEALKIKGGEDILEGFHAPCLHCPMAQYEMNQLTLEDIAKTYGLDLKGMLSKLNELAQGKKK